jgi:type II secretory pathway component PulK
MRHARVGGRARRGIVLVLVLWVVVLMSLIGYSLLLQVSVDASVTTSRKRQLEAEMLARAGVARAIVDLRNDLLFDYANEAKVFDGEGDVWARPEEGKDRVSLANDRNAGYYSVRVIDEQGLINLNFLTRSSLPLVAKILEELGMEEEDAKIVAAAILDWRDPDYIPSLENAASNDEGIAYAVIKAEDEQAGVADVDEVEPLVFRNEDYLTVDELLEVFGVSPAIFFGPHTPEAEYYSQFFDAPAGERFLSQLEEPLTYDTGRSYGLRDYFTVHGTGQLNINSIPFHVLVAMGKMAGGDGEAFAERVLKNRRGGKDRDIDNSGAYKDGTDLARDVEVAGVLNAVQGMGLPIDVKSTTFRIVSTGVVGDVRSTLEVLVYREMRRMVRDETFEARERAAERRERNSGRYERRQDRADESIVRYPYVRVIQTYKR